MLKLGITGGIGSGKSTVCEVFKVLGIPVFNSDEEARNVMVQNPSLVEKIRSHFGQDIYFKNGDLDRNRLSSLVFKDPEKLSLLNALVHPAVFEAFDQWIIPYENLGKEQIPFVIKEAALMFESKSYLQNSFNVLVWAPLEIRIKRIKERENWDEEKIMARIKNQWPENEKIKLSDYLIYNDEKHSLNRQVMVLFNLFKKMAIQNL